MHAALETMSVLEKYSFFDILIIGPQGPQDSHN